MSTGTAIEWTDATWNPVVGCTPVSSGCLNCYAATMARRLEGMGQERYVGLTVRHQPTGADPDKFEADQVRKASRTVYNGTVRLVPEVLAEPLRWRKPRRVFVCSMSDLFHENVPFEYIDRVFATAALCPQHTFQMLTKRPERMAEYLNSKASPLDRNRWDIIAEIASHTGKIVWDPRGSNPVAYYGVAGKLPDVSNRRAAPAWPLPNVWLGTSCENQAALDERVPHLLRCPAVVRFLSCEPLLGELRVGRWLLRCPKSQHVDGRSCGLRFMGDDPYTECVWCCEVRDALTGRVVGTKATIGDIHWVIVGGESGPKARPCDVAWVRSIVEHCKAAGVACFVKQLGAHVVCRNDEVSDWLDECHIALDDVDTRGVQMQGDPVRVRLGDRKGGYMSEWPEDLRVRRMPGGAA